MRTREEAFAALMVHIDECPLGWHNEQIIAHRSVSQVEVLKWLQQLHLLRAEADPRENVPGVVWSAEERRGLGFTVDRDEMRKKGKK